ncbi:hypothetical protein MD484_g4510, partial [Candolleomyces efflorescens]
MDALPLPLSRADPVGALPMTPSDPVITPIIACSRCSSRMGELRVYRGQGSPDRADRKGSIVQTCSSTTCFYTIFHTPAYLVADAEQLLRRLINPTLGNSGVLRLAPPTPPRHDVTQSQAQPGMSQAPASTQSAINREECTSGSCTIRYGRKSARNKDCIELLCKPCCVRAADTAKLSGQPRMRCSAHKTTACPKCMSAPGSILFPSFLFCGCGSTQPPPSSQLSRSSAPVVVTMPSARSLAVPIERRWTADRDAQQQKQCNEKTGKELQKEIDDTKRRSVMFIIYHTANEEPFRLQVVAKTWPQLRLQDFPRVLKDMGLATDSYVDVFLPGSLSGWNTVTLD